MVMTMRSMVTKHCVMRSIILFFCISILLFTSCAEDECDLAYTYIGYEAVYKTEEEIKTDIRFIDSRALENPGKIYYYGNLILISEKDQGIHIFDNSNVRQPLNLGFIAVEGNQDISLSDHYIYADTWFNVVIIDIEDISNPEVVRFIDNVKQDHWRLPVVDNQRLVSFVPTEERIETSCDDYRGGSFVLNDLVFFDQAPVRLSAGVPEFQGNGQAGSLSRMALFDNHFYYINDHQMFVFDVSDLENPTQLNELWMEWGIETIFPYQDKLFIGARNGMHILDNSDPANPLYLSTFAHANACDPVAVEGETAYITLRDGTDCQDFINQLDVVDISDVLDPQLIASFPMHHPIGVAVRNSILYLCDDDQGLKVFDVTNPEEIRENMLANMTNFQATDVISANQNLLMVIGTDGFFQINTSDPSNPEILSSILTND